jgi:hypothetical protein
VSWQIRGLAEVRAQRIGQRVLKRLVAFDPKELLYFDYAPMPAGPSSSFSVQSAVLRMLRSSRGAQHPPGGRSR